MKRDATSYTVGPVARLSGVTVRTLHHYDDIGLLRPGGRTEAGYRRYEEADLERLQQILFYRELGFPLDEIAAILDDSEADAREHLRRQHELLTERIGRLELMMAAIEREMEAQQMGIQLTPEERFEVFGDFDPDDYAGEVEERWGGTDACKESQRRAARYSKQDWLTIKSEAKTSRTGSPPRWRSEPIRQARRPWTSPRSTGSTSRGGSTSAAMTSTVASEICTWARLTLLSAQCHGIRNTERTEARQEY